MAQVPPPGPAPSLAERKILIHALSDRVSVNQHGAVFLRGANQRLSKAAAESCEARGWVERTSYGTMRATPAGRLALGLDKGVQSTTVQQRIDNESEVNA